MQAEKHIPKQNLALLTESSWEVCNKIGGIYTVLSTKAKVLQEAYGDKLVFIGPDVWSEEHASPSFKEEKTILKNFSQKNIADFGIKVRCGRWQVPGSPQVILVKFDGVYPHLDSLFATMWEKFGVDSLKEYGDYREGCAFAVASAVVTRHLADHLGIDHREVFVHYNEWTTGMGLLYTRLIMPEAATLFTTHATSIGRSICGNGKPLYDYFDGYNGDQMAGELNMEAKHSLEKTAAMNADCFTAVSELTAKEAAKLLDLRPQAVTPNGFEPGFVPGDKKYISLRKEGRKKLLGIASALKQREYGDETLIIATSGRNEYRNKGLDLYLDSLACLERKGDVKDVLALVLVPAWVSHPVAGLRDKIERGDKTASLNLFDEETGPDYITHILHNMDYDSVAKRIAELERNNEAGRNVSIVYIPCYLDGGDGIVDISYYDLLSAIDITVFPSYYEPWGYTPLESIAFGIPTVTSDKSGFGQWVLSDIGAGLSHSGVSVIGRTDSNYTEAACAIATQIEAYSKMSKKERKEACKAALTTAEKADWKYFINHYYEAFRIAENRRNQRI